MRAFDMALTALALRVSPPRPQEREERLVPAVDDASDAQLDRAAIPQERAALVVSLWPEARPCSVRAVFDQFPAPALLGATLPVSWSPPVPTEDARALQARVIRAFARTEAGVQVEAPEVA
jgi:hypothetical protein